MTSASKLIALYGDPAKLSKRITKLETALTDTEIQVWSSSSLQHVVLSQYWGDPPNAHILYIDIELTDSVDDIETGVG